MAEEVGLEPTLLYMTEGWCRGDWTRGGMLVEIYIQIYVSIQFVHIKSLTEKKVF
jgi:hypothetical protein